MKKETLLYMFYTLTVIALTAYFSLKIIYGEIKIPSFLTGFIFSVRKTTGIEFYPPNVYEEALKQRIQTYVSLKKRENFSREVFRELGRCIEKSKSTFRIIALGDSNTEGFIIAVSINDTWPKQLERKLNKLNLSYQFEVLNFGKGGAGTLEEVEIFEKNGLECNPDMVILQFYGNDWEDSIWIENRASQLFQSYKNQTFKLPDDVEKMIKKYKLDENDIYGIIHGGIAVIEYHKKVESIGSYEIWKKNVEKPLIHLIELCKKRNIILMVIGWDFEDSQKELLAKVLEEYHIPFLDLSPYLTSPNTRLPNDLHPSKLGYDIISDKVLEFIKVNKMIKGLK